MEADFLRFYQITNPLKLTWRKFDLLIRRLPPGANLHIRLKEEQEYNSGDWWKNEIDRRMGREPARREKMSLDEFRMMGGG